MARFLRGRVAERRPGLLAAGGAALALFIAQPSASAAPPDQQPGAKQPAAAPPEKSGKPAQKPTQETSKPAAPAAPPPAKMEPPKPKPAVGPGEGSGERRIEPPAAKPDAPKPADAKKTPAPETPRATPADRGRKAHQQGAPPKKPSASMPKGAERSTPNEAARRIVAGGPTAETLKKKTTDPELSALRDADRVLFPKPLEGARSDFTWDLPEARERGPRVDASGMPPDARLRSAARNADEVATDAEWLKSLTLPNLPVRLEARVVRYLKFYRDSAQGRAIARAWAKKSGRFVPALQAELAKAGLPTDLVWLSLIESAHNPTIISPAGAAGLWQFMPDSGRSYGLTVDRWVDERLDPQRSTEAAIRYLSDLHRRFGNWELAMAAYNMGYGGLTRAIQKFNTNDFWELSRYEAGIPWETTLYVPKIFAIAVVMNNKKAFGISDVPLDAAESFDAVLVDPGTSFEQIALAAEIGTRQVELLNPHYLASRTPPQRPGQKAASHRVRVPAGKGNQTRQRMSKVWASDSELDAYVVKFGDTVGAIATARGTNQATLAKLNKLRDGESLSAGTLLLVPRAKPEPSSAAAEDEAVIVVAPRNYAYPDRVRVFYRVRSGDSLARVASAFQITASELEAWNALDPAARLQPGMVLQVFVPKGVDLSAVHHVPEHKVRVLVAGSSEFFDHHEGLRGKKRMLVEVKSGDTLASIGRRYGMSVGWMERVNRQSRSTALEPGQKLVVYAPRSATDSAASATDAALALEPLPAVDAPHPDLLPTVDQAETQPAALQPAAAKSDG
jgi:membrane-bound lytic murein transglycosylase D